MISDEQEIRALVRRILMDVLGEDVGGGVADAAEVTVSAGSRRVAC